MEAEKTFLNSTAALDVKLKGPQFDSQLHARSPIWGCARSN